MEQFHLFPDQAPAPAAPAPFHPTEAKRLTFSGPYDRRALVITPSFLAWVAWTKTHHTEYGSALWVLDDAGARAFHEAAFAVVRLEVER